MLVNFAFCTQPHLLKAFGIHGKLAFTTAVPPDFAKMELMTLSNPVSQTPKAAAVASFYKFPPRNCAFVTQSRQKEAIRENQNCVVLQISEILR